MLTLDQIAAYRRDGFTIARSVLDTEELAALRVACDDLCAEARGLTADKFVGVTYFNIHRNANPFAKDIDKAEVVPGQIRRVTYPYAISATLNRFRAHPRLLGCAAALLGDDLVQIVNQVNFNPPGCGTGWGWHQDYRFRKAGIDCLQEDFVQTLLAIDLCAPETGGLRLIPGSSRLGDLHLETDNEHAERYFDASSAVTPELRPGDVILFNSHVIHGSTPNPSPHQRRVYINGYARAGATRAGLGMPVLRGGVPQATPVGMMEYEGDHELLPKAAKY